METVFKTKECFPETGSPNHDKCQGEDKTADLGTGWKCPCNCHARTNRARRRLNRIERLKSGNYAFGCWAPEEHHVCDEFCKFPTVHELVRAGINPEDFRMETRRDQVNGRLA